MKKIFTILVFAIFLSGCQKDQTANTYNYYQNINNTTPIMITTPTSDLSSSPSVINSQPIAIIKTSMGDITVQLFPKQAPVTVDNFIGLATGSKEWTHPGTNKKMINTPFYDGIIFHRVIDGFMIQTGDPLGKGIGGPGYQFKDEFTKELDFSKPYMLAMANAGPGTNGSQIFITVASTPHLNNRHTIFGEVIKGQEVVDKIASVPTGQADKPVKDVTINTITISSRN